MCHLCTWKQGDFLGKRKKGQLNDLDGGGGGERELLTGTNRLSCFINTSSEEFIPALQ